MRDSYEIPEDFDQASTSPNTKKVIKMNKDQRERMKKQKSFHTPPRPPAMSPSGKMEQIQEDVEIDSANENQNGESTTKSSPKKSMNGFPADPSGAPFETVAEYDFEGDLSRHHVNLRKGAAVIVYKEFPTGWCYGQCEEKTGYFPVSFLRDPKQVQQPPNGSKTEAVTDEERERDEAAEEIMEKLKIISQKVESNKSSKYRSAESIDSTKKEDTNPFTSPRQLSQTNLSTSLNGANPLSKQNGTQTVPPKKQVKVVVNPVKNDSPTKTSPKKTSPRQVPRAQPPPRPLGGSIGDVPALIVPSLSSSSAITTSPRTPSNTLISPKTSNQKAENNQTESSTNSTTPLSPKGINLFALRNALGRVHTSQQTPFNTPDKGSPANSSPTPIKKEESVPANSSLVLIKKEESVPVDSSPGLVRAPTNTPTNSSPAAIRKVIKEKSTETVTINPLLLHKPNKTSPTNSVSSASGNELSLKSKIPSEEKSASAQDSAGGKMKIQARKRSSNRSKHTSILLRMMNNEEETYNYTINSNPFSNKVFHTLKGLPGGKEEDSDDEDLLRRLSRDEYGPSASPSSKPRVRTVGGIEPEIIPGKDCIISGVNAENFVAGTLEKLLEWLIFREALPENKENFFLCYREKFVTPDELLNALVQLYEEYFYPNNKEKVLQFINNWMITYFQRDFNNLNLIDKLVLFLRGDSIIEENRLLVNTMKLDLLKLQPISRKKSRTVRQSGQMGVLPLTSLSTSDPILFRFLKWNSKVVAEQITLVHFKVFAELKPKDLMWKGRKLSEPLELFCSHFAEIQCWIHHSVEKSPKRKQANVLKKFVKIADYLFKIRNFDSLYAVVKALTAEKIFALPALQAVPKRHMQKLEKYEKLFDPANNFQQYKDHLSTVIGSSLSARPPILPYFVLTLKTIRYIDRNVSSITNDQFINFKKVQLLGSLFREIATYQKIVYSEFSVIESISSYLSGLKDFLFHMGGAKEVKSYLQVDGEDMLSPELDGSDPVVKKNNPMYGKIVNVSEMQAKQKSKSVALSPSAPVAKYRSVAYFMNEEDAQDDEGEKLASKKKGDTLPGRNLDLSQLQQLKEGEEPVEERKETLPADPTRWSSEQVEAWLQRNGLQEYQPQFKNHSIRGKELVMLGDTELKELGITKLGHRKRILKQIRSQVDVPESRAVPKLMLGSMRPAVNKNINLRDTFRKSSSSAALEQVKASARKEAVDEEEDEREIGSYGLSPRSIQQREILTERKMSALAHIDDPKGKEEMFTDLQGAPVPHGSHIKREQANIFSDDDYEEEAQLAQEPMEIWMKGYFKNECRLLRVNKNIEIAELEKKFAKEFKKRIKFAIKFKDLEGDFISVTKKTDLQYAILNSVGVVKLHLEKK